jgi:hypothetical protein
MKFRNWAVCAAFVLSACANDPQQHRPGQSENRQPIRALLSTDAMLFVSFDSDNDLHITSAEIEAGITREFARADANHDGTIGPLEFQTWSSTVLGGQQTAPYRLDFDRNVDNVITPKEFHDEIVARAHDYDANNDGVLTRDEFVRTVSQTRAPGIGGPNGEGQMRPGGREGGGRRGGGGYPG